MINLVPQIPLQQPQPESTSEPARPTKVRLGERILRRNEERAEQDAAARDREQSLFDVSQEEENPDIGENELFQACDHLCDQHPELVRAGLKIIKGFDPVEDDEEDVKTYLRKQLRLMGLNDAFGHGDWYTTRLGPTVSHLATTITDDFFDQAKTSDAAVPAAAALVDDRILDQAKAIAEAGGF